jgi:hypothetical protein
VTFIVVVVVRLFSTGLARRSPLANEVVVVDEEGTLEAEYVITDTKVAVSPETVASYSVVVPQVSARNSALEAITPNVVLEKNIPLLETFLVRDKVALTVVLDQREVISLADEVASDASNTFVCAVCLVEENRLIDINVGEKCTDDSSVSSLDVDTVEFPVELIIQ